MAIILGTDGADTITPAFVSVPGQPLPGAGEDSLIGLGGDDSLDGGGGADTILGDGNPLDDGGADTILGGAGSDWLDGGAGNDLLRGGAEDDLLLGGAGDDTLEGGPGGDLLVGDAGEDLADYANAASPVAAFLGSFALNTGEAAGDEYLDIEHLRGGNFADTLVGTAGANRLIGGNGADSLLGGDGADTLEGGPGADTLNGGGGADWASHAGAAGPIVVSLADPSLNDGEAKGDAYVSIENLAGGAFNDRLTASNAANVVLGLAGADTLFGLGGADTLDGGASNDRLDGGADADMLLGGLGADSLNGRDGDDVLEGGGDADTLIGEAGADTLDGGEDNDALAGGSGRDSLRGGAGRDALAGGTGADTLEGGEDADTLRGEADADWLLGGGGDDLLFAAGLGEDQTQAIEVLSGGEGSDTLSLMEVPLTGMRSAPGSNLVLAIRGFIGDLVAGQVSALVQFAEDGVFGVPIAWITPAGNGFADIEHLVGSTLDDRLAGDARANHLRGEAGADTLIGRGGADTLDGGAGFDVASHVGAASGVLASLADPALNTGDAAGDLYLGIEGLGGSVLDDTLIGDAFGNLLEGGAGADSLVGGDGADTIEGGAGNDTIEAGFNGNLVRGGGGDDLFYVNGVAPGGAAGPDDALDGGSGRDTISFQRGAPIVDVVFDSDTPTGWHGVDLAAGFWFVGTFSPAVSIVVGSIAFEAPGLSSIEDIEGSAIFDFLSGDARGNLIRGLGGDDRIEGRGGDDTLEGGEGADSLDGGAGRDLASYAGALAGLRVALGDQGANTGEAAGDTLTGIEDLEGSGHADWLSGDALANLLRGLDGADTLDGGAGDTLEGGAGDDLYRLLDASARIVETADGGVDGIATALLLPGLPDFVETLLLLGAQRFGIGNALDNRITGNATSNVLDGLDGADTLDGMGGADVLIGGAGRDVFFVDNAADVIVDEPDAPGAVFASLGWVLGANLADLTLLGAGGFGGVGNALANVITGNTGANRLRGVNGNDTLDGLGGADTVDGGAGEDSVAGGAGNDLVTGHVGEDTLSGGADQDTLDGGTGNDLLDGGAGNDLLRGADGADTLDGGAGPDTLIGGAGDDLFRFSEAPLTAEADRIQDYAAGEDIALLLTAFDPGGTTGLVAGPLAAQPGRFAANLTGLAPDATTRFTYETDLGRLWFDPDGNGPGARQIVVTLTGAPALLPGDILLI